VGVPAFEDRKAQISQGVHTPAGERMHFLSPFPLERFTRCLSGQHLLGPVENFLAQLLDP
jgi:hypothetical protein